MMKRKSSAKRSDTPRGGLILGAKWAEKINAIEGLGLTAAAEQRAADFDRRRLSPAERRKEILQAYRQG
jgi:hypothetical protein